MAWCVRFTRVRGHLVGNSDFSLTHMMSSTLMFWVETFHYWIVERDTSTLRTKISRKWQMSVWQRCHHHNIDTSWFTDGECGRASSGRLVKKWPGVNTSRLFEASGRGIICLQLRQASIWAIFVVNSSNVDLVSLATLFPLFPLHVVSHVVFHNGSLPVSSPQNGV